MLTILFGIVLMVRAGESKPFATLTGTTPSTPRWWWRSPRRRSALFERLGFLTTDMLLMFALLIDHRAAPLLPAAAYSIGVVGVTYVLFVYVLKTPLETGPFGF